jgi:hypothetical protein
MSNGRKKPTFWETSLAPTSGIWCDWIPRKFPIHTFPELTFMSGRVQTNDVFGFAFSLNCLSTLVTSYNTWLRDKFPSPIKWFHAVGSPPLFPRYSLYIPLLSWYRGAVKINRVPSSKLCSITQNSLRGLDVCVLVCSSDVVLKALSLYRT